MKLYPPENTPTEIIIYALSLDPGLAQTTVQWTRKGYLIFSSKLKNPKLHVILKTIMRDFPTFRRLGVLKWGISSIVMSFQSATDNCHRRIPRFVSVGNQDPPTKSS